MTYREVILDHLETMDAQVCNGGFYQYYDNIIEENKAHLRIVRKASQIGSEAKLKFFPELVKILSNFESIITQYEKLPLVSSSVEKEEREDALIENLEALDDRYDNIREVVFNNFEIISKIIENM